MTIFKDSRGNSWNLHLDWGLAERIQQECERPASTPENRKTYDLFNLGDQAQTEDLVFSDPETGRFLVKNAKCLIHMIYVICEKQCKERGVSDRDFAEIMQDTVSFKAAYDALMEELVNFIPNPKRQELFRKTLFLAEERQNTVLSEAIRLLDEKMTAWDAKIVEIFGEKMEKAEKEWNQKVAAVTKADVAPSTTTSSNVWQ